MAILKKSNKVLNSTMEKLDVDKIISNEIIEKDKDSLLNRISPPHNHAAKYIFKQMKENFEPFKNDIKAILDELIDSSSIETIQSVLEEDRKHKLLKDEIAALKGRLNSVGAMSPIGYGNEMERVEINLEIEEKNVELVECQKRFLKNYRSALKNVVLPKELNEVYNQINKADRERKEQIDNAIELTQAKLAALRKMRKTSDIMGDVNLLIDNKFKVPGISRKAVLSAKDKTPIIKDLIKR